jgi:hypothetical protein
MQSSFESNGTALHAIIMARDTPRINLSPPESDIRRASASAVAALSPNLSRGRYCCTVRDQSGLLGR